MHFYSDFNIFGLNEIQLINFKFRKLEDQNLSLFSKIAIQKMISSQSFDFVENEVSLKDMNLNHPEVFSNLK